MSAPCIGPEAKYRSSGRSSDSSIAGQSCNAPLPFVLAMSGPWTSISPICSRDIRGSSALRHFSLRRQGSHWRGCPEPRLRLAVADHGLLNPLEDPALELTYSCKDPADDPV